MKIHDLEKNVEHVFRNDSKYKFHEFEKGDSRFYEIENRQESYNLYSNIKSCVYVWAKKNSKKFAIKKQDKGIRVWRLE